MFSNIFFYCCYIIAVVLRKLVSHSQAHFIPRNPIKFMLSYRNILVSTSPWRKDDHTNTLGSITDWCSWYFMLIR